jgi:hypothetical protein
MASERSEVEKDWIGVYGRLRENLICEEVDGCSDVGVWYGLITEVWLISMMFWISKPNFIARSSIFFRILLLLSYLCVSRDCSSII